MALEIEGETWYFAGPGSFSPFSVIDVPGHTWVQTGPYKVKGRHCNIGPAGTASWWATGEPNKVLLFVVDGIINVCPENISSARAEWLKARGYVHFHEIVHFLGTNNSMPIWELHPKYVVCLKHSAVRFFYFDGGPTAPKSNHWVTPVRHESCS